MDQSKQKKWIGLALVLAGILAGVGIWKMQGGGEPDEPARGLTREDSMTPMSPTSNTSQANLVAMKTVSDEAEGTREVIEELTTDEEVTYAPRARGKSVLWIDGFVENAEGTPLDEVLEVVAKGKVFKGTKDRKEHRVPVGRDGRFRVAVSADTAAARLSLISKYQFLDEDEVWLKSEGGEAVLRPQLGAHVNVQVVTEPLSQEPLQDFSAVISRLWNWSGDVTPPLLDGNRLELFGMPPGRDVFVEVKATGYSTFSLQLEDLEAGKTTEAMVILKPEAVVSGRMVDNRGEPVPEGRILARKAGEGRWGGGMGTFSEIVDGQFEIHGLPAGDLELFYIGAGYSAENLIVASLRVGERRDGLIWRANKGLSVRGKVLWPDGGPARHVSVQLVGLSQREVASAMEGGGGFNSVTGTKTETDADGYFEISGFAQAIPVELMAEGLAQGKQVPRGLSKIKARRFVRENTVRARIENVLVGGPEVSMVLGEEQESLHGRVQDDLGNPIETFRLTATPIMTKESTSTSQGWGTAKGGVLRERCQDEDGAFAWSGIPSGDWSVEATASGYQDGKAQIVTLPTTKEMVLMLPRGARIFGRVVDQDEDKVLAAVMYSEVVDGVLSGRENSVAATAQFGFSITNLAPGTYSIYAKDPTSGDSPRREFRVAAGEIVEDVVLQLPGPGKIEGTVDRDWWEDGLEVNFQMESEGSNGWSMPHSAKVRSDGTFSVDELAPGTYRAQLEGHFSGGDGRSITSDPGPRETVEVISGQTSALHFRGAPPGSVRLRGRLLREGKGLSGHLIEMSGIEPSRSDVETISRANGDYSIILEGPGTYQVKVRPGDGGQRQIWTIEVGSGSQAMDLNLPSMGLTVIVTGPGGSALPFALDASHFSVEMMGVGPRRGSVDASGVNGNEVKFEGLAPETYRLRYTANVRRWNRTEETAESPSAWVLPRDLEITLQAGEAHKTAAAELRPGARLTGRVNDIPSDASRFLYVTVISEEGGGNIKTARIINGEFSVSGLLEGEVRVTCDGTNVDSEESHKAQVSYEAPAFLEIPYPTETE